jgi:hypothetical protein
MTLLYRAGLAAALYLMLLHPASAQWQGQAGAGLRKVSHTEDDSAGRRLVRETGWLPGIALGAAYTSGNITWSAALDWYRGDIDYRGQTQAGSPATSTTETALATLHLGASYTFQGAYSAKLALEGDYWKRDILGTGASIGLQERYRSERLVAGLAKTWHPSAGMVAADIAVLFSTPERMRVGFSGVLDRTSLRTESAPGLRIGARHRPAFAPALELRASYDWIKIARSEDAPVTRMGQFAGTVAQPEHARQGFTLSVSALF